MIVRVRDIERLLAVVGRDGISEVVPTMVPQWNLRVADPARRAAIKALFENAWRECEGNGDGDGQREAAFVVQETEAILTLTPLGLTQAGGRWRYRFPGAPGDRAEGFPITELMAVDAPTVKQGMHHPDGLLAFFGRGVAAGQRLPDCSNLDVAPTLLALMDIAIPAVMPGQVLGVTERLERLGQARQQQAVPALRAA